MDVSVDAWDSLGVETASVIIDDAAPANQRYKMVCWPNLKRL